jgi:hypothetical protein
MKYFVSLGLCVALMFVVWCGYQDRATGDDCSYTQAFNDYCITEQVTSCTSIKGKADCDDPAKEKVIFPNYFKCVPSKYFNECFPTGVNVRCWQLNYCLWNDEAGTCYTTMLYIEFKDQGSYDTKTCPMG